MAEQVKRRVNAARVAVAFAAAGVIAGAAATASGARDPVPPNSVGTQEVRNGTLQWKDLKEGEVYSKDQVAHKFLKIDAAAHKYLKIDAAANTYIKGESLNQYLKIEDAAATYLKESLAGTAFLKIEDAANTYIKGEALNGYLKIDDADQKFLKVDDAAIKYLKIEDAAIKYLSQADAAIKYLKIDDANNKFLKIDDAASQYLKQGTAILGDGSVRTGAAVVPPDGTEKLITVDRFFDVAIDDSQALPAVQITTADAPITWATDGKGGTIDNNTSGRIDFDSETDTQVIQLMWDDDGKTMVGTLSISVVGTKAFAQILIGL